MEVGLILLVCFILGFLVFEQLPSSRLTKASRKYESGQYEEAITILNTIYDKLPEAVVKLAECKCQLGKEKLSSDIETAKDHFNYILNLKEQYPISAKIEAFEIVLENVNYELSRIKYLEILAGKDLKDKLERLQELLTTISQFHAEVLEAGFNKLYDDVIIEEAKVNFEINRANYKEILEEKYPDKKIELIKKSLDAIHLIKNKKGVENQYFDLYRRHYTDLADNYYLIAIQEEKRGMLVTAISSYIEAKDYAYRASSKFVISNSAARIAICRLKNQEAIDLDMLNGINDSTIEHKTDFYFRYVRYLLISKDYTGAERLLEKHLKIKSPVIEKLKKYIQIDKQREALTELGKLNDVLDKIYENKLSLVELKDLYANLDHQVNLISSAIPTATEKLAHLKPSLFNRLLLNFITNKTYGNAIKLIEEFPVFWENPELLKNIGICSFGLVYQKKLSENNFRILISNWLTAVYSDQVILKSLESTSWDDQYTFSLIDAIGSKYQTHGTLLENVNYEPVSETNISIGATQRELLNQFESFMHQMVDDSKLLSKALDFYQIEKHAIEQIVALTSGNILLPSPYFAKKHRLCEPIIKALENIYVKTANEHALDVGTSYLDTNTKSAVKEYSLAKELVNEFVRGINEMDISALQASNINKSKTLIEKYKSISTTVEDLIYNAISIKAEEMDESEEMIAIMTEAIKFSTSKDKLKYQFSNYVANYCIGKVNENEIDHYKALTLMTNAYLYSPTSARICNNIVTLIRFNLLDILNNHTKKSTEIYSLLETIYPFRSDVFITAARELHTERKDILENLRASGVDISLFEGPLILRLGQSLNPEGEKLKKVLDYMKKLSTNPQSRNPFDFI